VGRAKDETDELVWTLFGVRVCICETSGAERDALERKEHELVEALADTLDPRVHTALPKITLRAAPAIF